MKLRQCSRVLGLLALCVSVSLAAQTPGASNRSKSFWVKGGPATLHGLYHETKQPAGRSGVQRITDGTERNKKSQPVMVGKQSIENAIEANRSVPWSIVLGLTLLTLIPALLLSITPMVRLLVVFHFLRQALGTQTAPSNQILMGLALMMTWFLMQPVLLEVEQQAVVPYRSGVISGEEALSRGVEPVKKYMLRYAREKDLAVFASAAMPTRPQSKDDLPIQVVIPAYMLSELKAGFQIGAVLFLPFLLVDLIVASVTTSIGMMQLPPVVISTPLKILLFVMVDGWSLLADRLVKSF